MTPSISVGLPHASWLPERVASVNRLRRSLGLGAPATWAASVPSPPTRRGFVSYHEETHRGPMWEWHTRLWEWALVQPVSHCLFLADDTVCGPYALDAVLAMIEAQPTEPIGLTSQHPRSPQLLRQGHHWYRAHSPWLVGWAYLMPRPLLAEFYEWYKSQPNEVVRGNEGGDDQLINRFLASIRVQTWHPLPTPFDHDLSFESSYGHPIENEGRREASTKAPWHLSGWRPMAEPIIRPPYTEPLWWAIHSPPPVLEVPPSEVSWEAWEADQ